MSATREVGRMAWMLCPRCLTRRKLARFRFDFQAGEYQCARCHRRASREDLAA